MNQLLYYNCNLFNLSNIDYNNFSFVQKELILKDAHHPDKFSVIDSEYTCSAEFFHIQPKKPCILICIKDNNALLKYTLTNLELYKVLDLCNILVIDDRPTTNLNKELCKSKKINYLTVKYDRSFNFSALNNIAAKLMYDIGIDTIILWNSDLWCADDSTLNEILKKHKENNSTISGTKLLYPNKSWNNEEIPHNISSNFSHKITSFRGTVQFGGSIFFVSPQFGTYFPMHYKRFAAPSDPYVDIDKPDIFLTGAFQIIDLKWFINNGGLNQSMAKNFQDVDLCLRAIEQNLSIFYFGHKKYMYHDESVLLSKQKIDSQFISDNFLFSKLWNNNRFLKNIYKL